MRSSKVLHPSLLLLFVFSGIYSFAAATCTLSTVNQTVTICTPANGATVPATFHVNAGSTDSATVTYMQVYVNGVLKLTQNQNFIDANLPLATGTNQRFTVQAHDANGVIFKTIYAINVSSSPTTNQVTVTSPVNNSRATSPVAVNATYSGTATYMKIWVDHVAGTVQQNTNTFNTSLTLASGPHFLEVQAHDATSGVTFTTPVNITVSGGTTGVVVTPSSASTPIGGTQQFTANTSVTWSASCGTISTSGLFTAPGSTGQCTITATNGTGQTGTATDTVVALPPPATGSYTTWKNGNTGIGQQTNETKLTLANVKSSTFGLKFSNAVDGAVYAQPLYMSGLIINGATHNVVFVATEHDSVYAFDADSAGAPLWHTTYLINGATTVLQAAVGSTISPQIGITSTPVIDLNTNTMYVVAETLEAGVYVFRLHQLDVHTGKDVTGSPVIISATGFQPKEQLQRPALLLASGNIYIGFGSQGDHVPYHGWLFAYSASTLQRVAAYNVTPGASAGSLWMSGAGPTVDSAGNIYVATSNGNYNGTTQLSTSVVKLSPNLNVIDFFTPFDEDTLSKGDRDLGSGGVLIVPDHAGTFPHELVVCGKPSPIYVINRDNMGHKGATSDGQIIQSLSNAIGGTTGTQSPNDHCFTTAAYFQGNLYFVGNNDVMKQFKLDTTTTGKITTTPSAKSAFSFVFPGAQPVTSSNGTTNGIVWAVDHTANAAALHAFDAATVSHELFRSGSMGAGTKWAVPTVMNGKVYVGTQSKIYVFGLL